MLITKSEWNLLWMGFLYEMIYFCKALCPINGNDRAWVWTVKSECRILLSSRNINITASRLPLKYCKNIPSGMQPLHTVSQTTVTSITTQEVSFSYQSRYHFSTSAALTGISHQQPTQSPINKLDTDVEITVQVCDIGRDSTPAVLRAVR